MLLAPRSLLHAAPRPHSCKFACSAMAQHPPKHVLIAGGGIIGASVAYYLQRDQGIASTIVEQHDIAGAASGKAGGFLALDWCDGSPSEALMRLGFQLHLELAAALGDEAIGYRPVSSFATSASSLPMQQRSGPRSGPAWLNGDVGPVQGMSTTATTAQVHPARLTRALVEASGARVVHGAVQGVEVAPAGGPGPQQRTVVSGARVAGQVVRADALVLAMGPWGGRAAAWLAGMPQVAGQIGHSLVLRPQQPLPAHALYVSWRSKSGAAFESEVYPRPDGTVWLGGGNAMVGLPDGAADVQMLQGAADNLEEVKNSLATALQSAEVLERNACIRPLSADGTPVIGLVPGTCNAYVATGHSCWGIAQGPSTGKALAELIATGAASCTSLAPFSPSRFSQPSAGQRRGQQRLAEERTHLSDKQALPTQ